MGIRAMKNYKARRGDWRVLGVGKECQVKRGEVRTFEQT